MRRAGHGAARPRNPLRTTYSAPHTPARLRPSSTPPLFLPTFPLTFCDSISPARAPPPYARRGAPALQHHDRHDSNTTTAPQSTMRLRSLSLPPAADIGASPPFQPPPSIDLRSAVRDELRLCCRVLSSIFWPCCAATYRPTVLLPIAHLSSTTPAFENDGFMTCPRLYTRVSRRPVSSSVPGARPPYAQATCSDVLI